MGERYCWRLLGRKGELPNKSCCMSAVKHNNKILVFGGGIIKKIYRDLFEYNIDTEVWSKVECSNSSEIEPTLSHSAVLYKNSMIIFGGMTDGRCHNHTYSLDIEKLRWHTIQHGDPPPPRKGHTAVVYKDKMYVVMGAQYMGALFNDLHAFDFTTNKWECIDNGNTLVAGKPKCGRTGHSTSLYKNELIIFGGMANTGPNGKSEWLNDVVSYNIDENRWREIQANTIPSALIPEGRYSHSSWIQGHHLYIFGGDSTDCTTYYNDLWVLNLQTNAWRKLETFGDIPNQRSGHSTVIHNGMMLSFGGEKPTGVRSPTFSPQNGETEVEYSNNLFAISLFNDGNTTLKQYLINEIVRSELYKNINYEKLPNGLCDEIQKWIPRLPLDTTMEEGIQTDTVMDESVEDCKIESPTSTRSGRDFLQGFVRKRRLYNSPLSTPLRAK